MLLLAPFVLGTSHPPHPPPLEARGMQPLSAPRPLQRRDKINRLLRSQVFLRMHVRFRMTLEAVRVRSSPPTPFPFTHSITLVQMAAAQFNSTRLVPPPLKLVGLQPPLPLPSKLPPKLQLHLPPKLQLQLPPKLQLHLPLQLLPQLPLPSKLPPKPLLKLPFQLPSPLLLTLDLYLMGLTRLPRLPLLSVCLRRSDAVHCFLDGIGIYLTKPDRWHLIRPARLCGSIKLTLKTWLQLSNG